VPPGARGRSAAACRRVGNAAVSACPCEPTSGGSSNGRRTERAVVVRGEDQTSPEFGVALGRHSICAGIIRPIVEAVLPLHQAREAYERGIRDYLRRKLVLAVVGEDGGTG
jgi:hypothetical protein